MEPGPQYTRIFFLFNTIYYLVELYINRFAAFLINSVVFYLNSTLVVGLDKSRRLRVPTVLGSCAECGEFSGIDEEDAKTYFADQSHHVI